MPHPSGFLISSSSTLLFVLFAFSHHLGSSSRLHFHTSSSMRLFPPPPAYCCIHTCFFFLAGLGSLHENVVGVGGGTTPFGIEAFTHYVVRSCVQGQKKNTNTHTVETFSIVYSDINTHTRAGTQLQYFGKQTSKTTTVNSVPTAVVAGLWPCCAKEHVAQLLTLHFFVRVLYPRRKSPRPMADWSQVNFFVNM